VIIIKQLLTISSFQLTLRVSKNKAPCKRSSRMLLIMLIEQGKVNKST